MNPPRDAYTRALEQERQTWNALHSLQRTDPAYAEALTRWRAAADSIGAAVQQQVENPPSATEFRSLSARTPAKVSSRRSV